MGIQAELKAALTDTNANLGDIRDRLAQESEARLVEQQRLRGIKFIRLPLIRGTASGSALTMGGDNFPIATPEPGFVWSIRHLVIEGMTASASTPDVMNILRAGRIIWQLNGNQFAQTWGRGEILLNAGETLTYQSVGTFASTAQIIAHGTALETPGELAGKLGA